VQQILLTAKILLFFVFFLLFYRLCGKVCIDYAAKKLPTLWTPSYFVGSVGNVSTNVVQQYIETQRGK
jgi:REP element-mobilizing transposase RayT